MADPPRASAVSPNGVKIESRAMLPTTSRLIRSHPVGGGQAEEGEGVGEHRARRAGEQQARVFGRGALGCADRTCVVIPTVDDGGELVEIDRDAMRLPVSR